MTKDKTPKSNPIELSDQELDQAPGGAAASPTATVEPTYKLFSEDGKPVRSGKSVSGDYYISMDVAP